MTDKKKLVRIKDIKSMDLRLGLVKLFSIPLLRVTHSSKSYGMESISKTIVETGSLESELPFKPVLHIDFGYLSVIYEFGLRMAWYLEESMAGTTFLNTKDSQSSFKMKMDKE